MAMCICGLAGNGFMQVVLAHYTVSLKSMEYLSRKTKQTQLELINKKGAVESSLLKAKWARCHLT